MYFVFKIHFEKKYFVFCIFRPTSKVLDKSISDTFFQKNFVFLYLNNIIIIIIIVIIEQKCIFYNTDRKSTTRFPMSPR